MKKDRNTFFNESGFQTSSYSTMPNMGMMPNYGMNGYGQQSSQSFYAGPMNQMNSTMPVQNDYMSEIESRLAKIERQISRMDARINKLESLGTITTDSYDNTTNMYML